MKRSGETAGVFNRFYGFLLRQSLFLYERRIATFFVNRETGKEKGDYDETSQIGHGAHL